MTFTLYVALFREVTESIVGQSKLSQKSSLARDFNYYSVIHRIFQDAT